jgi:hypothetical protein
MKRTLSRAEKLLIIGLVANAVGIWIQAFAGDPEYPSIPPGPIVLVIIAAIVALGTRWRGTALLGALLSLWITVGAFATPFTARRLGQPEILGVFVGTIVQVAGLALGDIAGVAAAVQNLRRKTHG